MKRLIVTIAVALLATVPLQAMADPTLEEAVEKMTIIESPDFRNVAETKKRFRYVLPMLVERCSDIEQSIRAGDIIASLYLSLDDAGLGSEEGFLALTNNLHRMTMATSRRVQSPIKCVDAWAAYVTLRLEGMGPEESRKGVEQILVTLMTLE